MAREDVKIDVCYETVFTDLPYEDRIREIAEIGFRAVEFGHPEEDNFKLLYDIYHMQIMNGNVTETIRDNIDIITHMHVAGVSGRAEPHECEQLAMMQLPGSVE